MQQYKTSGDIRSLGDINACLVHLGFQKIGKNRLAELIEQHGKNPIASALVRARNDQNAYRFLTNHFMPAASDKDKQPAQQAEQGIPAPSEADNEYSAQNTSNARQEQARDRGRSNATGGHPEETPPQEQEHISKHVYGGKAVVCFGVDMTRADKHTLALDAAETKGGRAYNWQDKIRIQMTTAELPFVLAVFMGWNPKIEFKSHGEKNDRGFAIEDQSKHFFVSVFASGKSARAVPVPKGDAYEITTLILRQMRKNAPWMSTTEIIALAKRFTVPQD